MAELIRPQSPPCTFQKAIQSIAAADMPYETYRLYSPEVQTLTSIINPREQKKQVMN